MDEALRQLRELLHPKRTNCVPIWRFFPHRPADAIDSGNDSVKRQSSVIQPERGGHDRPLQKELSNNRWIRVSGAPGNVGKEREYTYTQTFSLRRKNLCDLIFSGNLKETAGYL